MGEEGCQNIWKKTDFVLNGWPLNFVTKKSNTVNTKTPLLTHVLIVILHDTAWYSLTPINGNLWHGKQWQSFNLIWHQSSTTIFEAFLPIQWTAQGKIIKLGLYTDIPCICYTYFCLFTSKKRRRQRRCQKCHLNSWSDFSFDCCVKLYGVKISTQHTDLDGRILSKKLLVCQNGLPLK